jgi:hypothetical protein
MATRMQQRRGTAAQWTAANPVLAAGEIGFETDTSKFKMGNGSSTWSALTYFANAAELAAIIDGAPAALNTLNELAEAMGDNPAFLSTIATNLTNHENDTTSVHGIADTSVLITQTQLSQHSSTTLNVHGIADTAQLESKAGAQTKADAALAAAAIDATTKAGTAKSEAITTAANDATTKAGTAKSEAITAAANTAENKVSTHNSETENVHGIEDTAELVTQTQLSDAISTASVDQSALAGVGLDWNAGTDQFDIDSTVATKVYADGAVSTHQSDTTSVHGIADTSLLATKSYADTAEADAITAAGTAADTKISTAVAALTKSSVGLANVDNTADASKPVSSAQATAIATAKSEAIADATSQVNALLTGAPAALNTLDELAAALGDDANFASTVTTNLAAKAPLASPTFTGTVTVAAAGVAFTDGTQTKEGVASRTPIIAKTDSYTLSALTERDSLIEVAKSTATTITIPTDATLNFPIGTSIDVLQTSTGQVTIAGAGGVTVNATPGLKLRTTWSSVTLFKRAANTWVVFGDLTA